MGIGGAPEGVITAAALRCLGGEIQARFRYRNDEERERGARMGHGDESRIYHTEDLASGENLVFAATGVTQRRPARGRPLLRRRRPDPLAGDGLPDQDGPLRRHRPHVRPGPPARASGSRRAASRWDHGKRASASSPSAGRPLEPGSTDWPLHQYLLDLTGRERPRICFIGTASGDNPSYAAELLSPVRPPGGGDPPRPVRPPGRRHPGASCSTRT